MGGGAYMAGKHRARREEEEAMQDERISGVEQQQQYAQPPPPPAAPPPQAAPQPSGGVSSDAIERLEQLGKLHEQGVLTDDEFAREKAKVLGG